MESIIRNVRDIETSERQVLEHVLGQKLRENQQVIIQVVTPPTESRERDVAANAPAPPRLPEWCNVFAGLSDEELAEVDAVIRQRADLTRLSEWRPHVSLPSRYGYPLRGPEAEGPTVAQKAAAYLQAHQQFTFSAFTRYEVTRGLKAKGAVRQLAQLATFCAHSTILPVTDPIFDRAADLWVICRAAGRPQKDADLLIGATALEHGLTLATGNAADFSWIPGLAIEDWRRVQWWLLHTVVVILWQGHCNAIAGRNAIRRVAT
jgi:tRNA(fMet)-specific endonuclease VapC